MKKSAYFVGFWLAAWWGLSAGASVWAKPAALPAFNQFECPDCGDAPGKRKLSIELDITSKGITLKFGAGVDMPGMAPAPAIDAVCPTIVPGYLEALLKLVGESVVAPAEDRDRQIRQLFGAAELYRHTGHFSSARHYYQRVHRLAPTSHFGMIAIDRLTDVEERLREAEESGLEDQDETVYRRIQRDSMPLGLVEVAY